MSSLQTALCCLCSPVHAQSTHQHPASHFVFLRAPTGLDCQVLPVPRQQLHPLHTILPSNYLNRGTGMGKNFGAYLCWSCMLNHTCTQTNITYTWMCFVQQPCISGVRFTLFSCSTATPPECLSPEAVALTSAATEWPSFLVQLVLGSGVCQHALCWSGLTEPGGVFSPACFCCSKPGSPSW